MINGGRLSMAGGGSENCKQ